MGRPPVRLTIVLAVVVQLAATVPATQAALGTQSFVDVPIGHTFHDDIAWLAASGITKGCNPPDSTRFCPDEVVTRGQMAAFLVRALGLSDDGGGDLFVDDDGHLFEGDIDRLGEAGVTRGCNPPSNDRFCPDEVVTRGQMAAFIRRALAPPEGLCSANPISEPECQALLAIHDPAGFWGTPPPWLSNPEVCTWRVVTCEGAAVVSLDFRPARLNGPMPAEIGDLPNLRMLLFGGLSNITGEIPPEIGDLTSLEVLQIGTIGSLTGPLPPEIGNLASLREINIGFTDLTGPLPAEIGDLTSLEVLRIYDNPMLDGPIPPEIGNLASLRIISLANGQLEGPIPAEIGNLTDVETLELPGNRLTGPIPATIGDMTGLTFLSLGRNELSGEVPAPLRDLPNLTTLSLRGQTGCLFATDQGLADWLTSHDPEWNDGCP